jgi:acyl-CoA thioesterase-2
MVATVTAHDIGNLPRTDPMTGFPRPTDVEVLGLEFEEDGRRAHFELVPDVARHDGALYGGTAIAVSVAAMEAATGRPSLWVTTQYVATATLGDTIDVSTEVLATGRNVTQAQVTGRLGGKVLFVSVGSTATPREGGLEGQFQRMPVIEPPEKTEPMAFGQGRTDGFQGFTAQVEYRLAAASGPAGSEPDLAMWVRLKDGHRVTPAGIAFVADMVPGAIARAAGLVGGGASLDNSLRFGRIPDEEEWILLELRAQMAVGSHAHGSVHVWSRDGLLLAVGGQSANMRHMVTQEEFKKFVAAGGASG